MQRPAPITWVSSNCSPRESYRSIVKLTDQCKQHLLPHLVHLVAAEFHDPNSSVWRLLKRCKLGKPYLPHGHFARSEEKEVRVLWHFARLLEENVEVEEVLQGRNRTQGLQLVFVRLNLGNFVLWTRLRLGPLIAPKVPLSVQPVRLQQSRVKQRRSVLGSNTLVDSGGWRGSLGEEGVQ